MAGKSKRTDLFEKVGGAVLGSKEPNKGKSAAKKAKPKLPVTRREIPKKLRGFFESRHAGWPEYVMLKAQLMILALFVAAVVHLVFLPDEGLIFLPLMAAISGLLVYLTVTQLKSAFKRDYPAYRSFVTMCIAVAWVFVLILKLSSTAYTLEALQTALIPPAAAVGFVAVSFAAFRLKYGRNFTYGTVEEARGRRAVVRIGYDIRSNVKAGLYPLESFAKVERGDIVKVGVERPMLGLRGARIKAILEKAK